MSYLTEDRIKPGQIWYSTRGFYVLVTTGPADFGRVPAGTPWITKCDADGMAYDPTQIQAIPDGNLGPAWTMVRDAP